MELFLFQVFKFINNITEKGWLTHVVFYMFVSCVREFLQMDHILSTYKDVFCGLRVTILWYS